MDEDRRRRHLKGLLFALVLVTAGLLARHAWASSLAGLHWIPFGVLTAGLIYASGRRVRAGWKAHALRRAQAARAPRAAEPAGVLACRYGLEGRTFLVGPSAPNACFSLGLLRPGVYVAEDLQDLLDSSELEAIFRHEVFHVRRNDPLRFAAARFLADLLFWLPAIRDLCLRFEEEAEVRADDFARGQDASALASALVKVAERARALLRPVASVGASPLLGRRVRRLVGERVILPALIRPRSALVSGVGLALMVACTAVLPTGASPPAAPAWACADAGSACCACVGLNGERVGFAAG